MANEFAHSPTLEQAFPPVRVTWTDPVTGMVIPKSPEANLEWRLSLLTAAADDPELQADLLTACSKSLLFFVNFALFTVRVFETDPADGTVRQASNTHVPMVTWEIQDRHLLWLEEHIEQGRDGLTDKSRDMGATWNHLALLLHRFLFRDAESHLLISRKEDAVDMLDGTPRRYPHGAVADPGTLFGKLDYMLRWLPDWMVPTCSRKKLHLVNQRTKTRIDGESSNATAGSSDRRTSIFLDEMAKMDEAESIKRSTADVSACRLACSTPHGAGTTYSKWRLSGVVDVFVLPWWEHPEKGYGRYIAKTDLGRFKIRSPWYDLQAATRSPKELATEVDMDHVGSGDTFFEAVVIEQHRVMFARPPHKTFKLNFRERIAESAIAEMVRAQRADVITLRASRGPWKWWGTLGEGRPDQTKRYVLACDIGRGMGASNSVINVFCVESREKVGAFADANTPPYELAKLAVAACLWVGGRGRPVLIWENNGDPGFDFGNVVTKVYQYPNVYFDRAAGTSTEKVGKRYGWRSSPEKKAAALGMLRRAYSHGGFINHDDLALTEALSYITYESGGIGPAALVEESSSARQTHGDRVIGDMLCLVAAGESVVEKHPAVVIPHRTFAHRLHQYQDRHKARDGQFDFSRS